MQGVGRVIVVGCGVSGLSSAVALLEAGLRQVEILGAEPPARTTSSVAAAIWYPYKAWPQERVLGWAQASFGEFVRLAWAGTPGVSMCGGLELFRHGAADPWWRACVPGWRRARREELPPGFANGWHFTVPVLEMPLYLEWLLARFHELGGRLRLARLESLQEALAGCDALVNCSGLGARELAGDRELYPVRGQVLRVPRLGIERFVLDEHGPGGVTYVVPRSQDCILGGTAEPGEEGLEPDPAASAQILERCAALEPRLAGVVPLGAAVGLRPCRPAVRLEAETPAPGRLLVHNYGHGGAGVTLSWGCAREAAALVAGALGLRILDGRGRLVL